MTAPNGLAQQAVIRQALANAHVNPSELSYIEAHGTGTSLGDPIEVEALAAIYGEPRPAGLGCALASVKTNLGHMEAAAGIAGVIKAILAMNHEAIPAHLHFQRLNPHINLDNTPFYIPITERPWPAGDQPRLAAVSSFGFGGTNAHVILEEAPQAASNEPVQLPAGRPYVLPLSAYSPDALAASAEKYPAFLTSTHASFYDICYTASLRRTHYDHRAAVVGTSAQELTERLALISQGESRPGAALADGRLGHSAKLAFVFSGQGPQWWGMGRELMANEPVYAETVEKIARLFSAHVSWSLIDELNRPENELRLDQTEIAQPAIFALQVALAELWKSWGVVPSAVVGHSVGEIAAAHVAGLLTLEEAVRVAYHRSRLMQQATGLGKMAAVELSAAEAQAEIAAQGCVQQLSVAAINAPTSITLSGEAAALEKVLQALQQRGVNARMLRVNYAFHSPQMEPYNLELALTLRGLEAHPARIPIYSSVSGQLATAGQYSADYWGRNIRQPVQFASAIAHLIGDGYRSFVEISPHPVLAASLTQCLEEENQPGLVLASLRRGQADVQTLFNSLAELYVNGYALDWETLYPNGECVSLPVYPWQRQRYWFEAEPSPTPAHLPLDERPELHPLLGRKLLSPAIKEAVYQAYFTPTHPPLLADHRIFDNILVPGTAYLEMALVACAQQLGEGPCTVEDFTIQKALAVPEDQFRTVQLVADPVVGSFQVYSLETGGEVWNTHAAGRFRHGAELPDAPSATLGQAQQDCPTAISVADFYQHLESLGIAFGSHFRGLAELWRSADGQQSLSRLQTPASVAAEKGEFRLHPALLDACFQTLGATFLTEADSGDAWLPVGLERFSLLRAPVGEWWCHAVLHPSAPNASLVKGDLFLFDESDQLFAICNSLRLQPASRSALQRLLGSAAPSQALYTVTWQPEPLPQFETVAPQKWLIFKDVQGVGEALAQILGPESVLVSPAVETLQVNAYHWQLNPASPADFRRLIEAYSGEQAAVGVAYLWNLDDSALEVGLQGALHLVQALAAQSNLPRLFLVTRGAQPWLVAEPAAVQASTWGFGRTVQLEHPELQCTCLDLDPAALPGANAHQLAAELQVDIQINSPENQILYRNDVRYVARLASYQAAPAPATPLHLAIHARGVFDNLVIEPKAHVQPGPGEVEIRVCATGLNFRDVLNALGMYPGDPGPLGGECAGVITSLGEGVTTFQVGDPVLGFALDSFSTYALADVRFVAHKPPQLTFAQAAALPSVFLTALYGLQHLAQIKPGDRVLIHAAAGGVGMAAVQIARRAGAVIFGTAGSAEKRALIAAQGVDHPLDSRSLDFADQVLALTQGRGVDIVLNSLAGEFISSSVACLQPQGCFLEIGKRDIWTPAQMSAVRPAACYHVYDLLQVMRENPTLIQSLLADLLTAFSSGELQPSPTRVFPLESAAEAFRFMAQAKHVGKIVLTLAPNPLAPVVIRPDATYLITGGMGGLGPILADGLVQAGARSIALMGRHAPSDAVRLAVSQIEAQGAQVRFLEGDVSQFADVERALHVIQQTMPPLKGILHAAGTLEDGVLLQQNWERFGPVLAPKIDGAALLCQQTQNLALDFLVLFSSASAVLGSAGQANYAAANAFLDTFATWQAATGIPALSIGWGGWTGAGMAARLSEQDQQRFARQGLVAFSPQQGVALLTSLLGMRGQVMALPFDWDAFVGEQENRSIPPLFINLAHLARSKDRVKRAASEKTARPGALQRLNEAAPNKRKPLLQAHVREQAVRVLGLSATFNLDVRQPLREIGMDSLMAVELRNAISASLQLKLPSTLLFDYPTIDALTSYLTSEIWPSPSATAVEQNQEKSAQNKPSGTLEAEIQALSDDEAEAALLAEFEKPKRK